MLILLVFPSLLFGQEKYHIIGEIDQLKDYKMVYLEYGLIGEEVIDSAKVVDGKFEFKGEVIQPTYAQISIRSNNKVWAGLPQYMELYLCSGNIFIVGEKFDPKILKGNDLNETFAKYKIGLEPLQGWRRKSDLLAKENHDLMWNGLADERAYDYSFLNSNPLNYLSFRLMQGLLSEETVLEFEEKYEKLKHLNISEKSRTIFEERLKRYKNRAIGQEAIDFSFQSVDGEILKLSDLRGKSVLIRFWDAAYGSKEDVYLQEVERLLYEHQKLDFAILRISLHVDNNNSNWKKLVQENTTKYVRDVCLDNENRKLVFEKYAEYVNGYDVNDMFSRFLLDKEGKIKMVGVNLQKLNNYLKNL